MSPLLSLPTDVLLAIPWEDSDLWSLVLTCRLFHQFFTPILYGNFDEDMFGRETQHPGHWKKCFRFLRTVCNNSELASYVYRLSLELPSRGILNWDHEQFRRLASNFGVSSEFNIVALPESTSDQQAMGNDCEETEEMSEVRTLDKDATGKYYDAEQFMAEFGRSLLSKLPGLQQMTMNYSHDFRLFDSTLNFPHLMDVKIASGYIFNGDSGDNQFNDALRLLSLPKLRKWSLSCDRVKRSSVRSIPPQSSPVQEMEICCPNIPAEDFDYLLSVPRTMKVFCWTGKAWTCHRSLDDDDGGGGGGDNESVEDERLEDIKCETTSVESTVASLRHARLHLEELTLEYAFVGTCPHSNGRPGNLNDFVQLKKVKVSPQVLHGFHRCASPETCLKDCSHLQDGNRIITHLPPRMQHLSFWMQGNGDTLADTIAQIVRSRSLPLVQILLYSPLHCHDTPQHEGDKARRHVPMTSERYYDLRTECSSGGVTLDSCCYRSCFRDIAEGHREIFDGQWLPSDIPIDKAAIIDEWEKMGGLQRIVFRLHMIERGEFSTLHA